MTERRSHYQYAAIIRDEDGLITDVFIRDLDGPLSVTNDAERVCKEIHGQYPLARVFYEDTIGRWDELVHRGGVFQTFAPGHPPPIPGC